MKSAYKFKVTAIDPDGSTDSWVRVIHGNSSQEALAHLTEHLNNSFGGSCVRKIKSVEPVLAELPTPEWPGSGFNSSRVFPI